MKEKSEQCIKTTLSPEQIEQCTVFPGWVLIEPISPPSEVKTSGGLVLPQKFEFDPSLVSFGRVVAAGEYFDRQCGAQYFKGWGDLRGQSIVYHPHNPWKIRGVGERVYLVIKSTDIMLALPEGSLG